MSQDNLVNRELMSALSDGQLRGDELASAFASLAKSDQALSTWHVYHLVGDVLRAGDLGDARGDMAFVSRLRAQLTLPVGTRSSDEPVPLDEFKSNPHILSRQSANDASTRWKVLAGFASMVAVAVVGWHLASGEAGLGLDARLAAVSAGSTTATASKAQAGAAGTIEPPVMLRDARLDELLAAHKQFGGTSALQMPAGFLRNATYENPAR